MSGGEGDRAQSSRIGRASLAPRGQGPQRAGRGGPTQASMPTRQAVILAKRTSRPPMAQHDASTVVEADEADHIAPVSPSEREIGSAAGHPISALRAACAEHGQSWSHLLKFGHGISAKNYAKICRPLTKERNDDQRKKLTRDDRGRQDGRESAVSQSRDL